MKIALVCLAMICLMPAVTFAEPIAFNATVDKNKAGVGEPVLLTLTFSGVQSAEPPHLAFDGFSINYIGPFTQLSLINGIASASVSHRYRCIPQKTGFLPIGPITANVGGQTLTAAAITIDVSSQPTPAPSPGASLSINDRAYVVLETNKKTAFINEKLILTVRLFVNRLPIKDVRFPAMDPKSFSLGDFSPPRQYQTTANGIPLDVLEFETSLFGTRAGDFALGPAQIVCTLLVSRNQENSLPPEMQGFFAPGIFNNFFGSESQSLELKSQPIDITILPLPEEGKPADFSGAVGNFTFNASVRPQKVRLGDPVTVTMTVQGQGNMATVSKPHFVDENDFKMYEPEIKENQGIKTFEQVVSPMSKFLTQIPEIRFTFFDPAVREYRTLTAGPWPLEVTDAPSAPSAAVSASGNQVLAVSEEKLGSDIFYIKESGKWRNKEDGFLYQQPAFWVMIAFPLPVLWGILLWAHERKRLEGDTRYARRLRAPRKAKNGLRLARQLLAANKNKEFYGALAKTLREYFGDRFHIPPSSVSLETFSSHGDISKIPADIIAKISSVIKDSDAAQYAPMTFHQEQMKQAFDDCETIIDYFEKEPHVKIAP